ncbi:hypothetical protein EDD86DRAFT_18401 [Gorgonomyces haynaldii]|nr:hypothetical protein EDD86DRAFT_18401 [Gorgonomyces haynaldii]
MHLSQLFDMYFSTGTPRVLTDKLIDYELGAQYTSKQAPTICLKKCTPYFATITYNSLSLWLIHPAIQLAKVTRADKTLQEDGENVDLIWKPDGTQLVLITNKGFLHFYSVTKDGRSLELAFMSAHQFEKGPGENDVKGNCSVVFQMALEIDIGTQCGIGLKDELLVCTTAPPSIVSLSWSGDVNISATTTLTNCRFYQQKEPIVSISKNADDTFFTFVTLSGRVYLCRRKMQDSKLVWEGVCVYIPSPKMPPATITAFNSKFGNVAIGNMNGAILVFELFVEHEFTARFTHAMGQVSGQTKKSPVSCLQWTSDGFALAASWTYGGLSIWSVYGSLLSSTITEDTHAYSADGVITDTTDLYLSGVQDLFWGTADTDLFVLPMAKEDMPTDLFVLPFAKSAILTCHSWNNGKHISLIGSDRIMVYTGLNVNSQSVSHDPIHWDTIHIPPMYLAENWPVLVVSINATGQFIAIAGKHGLAHYNLASGKWKLFGNEQHEKSFSVSSIVWFRSMMICGCQDATGKHEIRVFSRETRLDNSNILHTEPIGQRIVAMNITESHLLVYSEDYVIRYFSLHVKPGISIQKR